MSTNHHHSNSIRKDPPDTRKKRFPTDLNFKESTSSVDTLVGEKPVIHLPGKSKLSEHMDQASNSVISIGKLIDEYSSSKSNISLSSSAGSNDESLGQSDRKVDQVSSVKYMGQTLLVDNASISSENPEDKSHLPAIIPRFEDIEPSKVDQFGFILPDVGNEAGSERSVNRRSSNTTVPIPSREYRFKESKWIEILSNWNQVMRQKPETIKKLCRDGIPDSIRPRIWMLLAGVDKFRKPGVFEEMCAKERIDIYDVIERDVNRCYPDHFL